MFQSVVCTNHISRGEDQKGVSDIFGEMDIYIYIYIYIKWKLLISFSTGKSTVIHESAILYYKQMKSVHKVRSNLSFVSPVKLVKCHLYVFVVLSPRFILFQTMLVWLDVQLLMSKTKGIFLLSFKN